MHRQHFHAIINSNIPSQTISTERENRITFNLVGRMDKLYFELHFNKTTKDNNKNNNTCDFHIKVYTTFSLGLKKEHIDVTFVCTENLDKEHNMCLLYKLYKTFYRMNFGYNPKVKRRRRRQQNTTSIIVNLVKFLTQTMLPYRLIGQCMSSS